LCCHNKLFNNFKSCTYVPAAQRIALLALGRAWTLLGSRKNLKPEKCSKMRQNPQRPVHALLGSISNANLL